MKALLLAATAVFSSPECQHEAARQSIPSDSITGLEMNLSAFGVESDDFPSIKVAIDFTSNSSNCKKTYYNPAFKSSTYKLSNPDIKRVLQLLEGADLTKLKTKYAVSATDQATSTIVIYAKKRKYIIEDYGLNGEYPLQELYKIVYRL